MAMYAYIVVLTDCKVHIKSTPYMAVQPGMNYQHAIGTHNKNTKGTSYCNELVISVIEDNHDEATGLVP